jgi:hypothetical protein
VEEPQVPPKSWPPPIWRVVHRERVNDPGNDVIVLTTEAIYDETPGYVGCLVRSHLSDGYTEWDLRSRRFAKTDGDGGWERVA